MWFRAGWLAPVLLSALIAGCGIGAPPPAVASGHVVKYVCSGAHNPCPLAPVRGIDVSFKAVRSGSLQTARTDETGAYTIKLVPGAYQVDVPTAPSVTQEGIDHPIRILAGPQQLVLTAGENVTADLQIACACG
jgi:hypothetical protein